MHWKQQLSIRWQRLTRFEYWNYFVLYAPLFWYWLWLSLKARTLIYFTATNPAIKNAGTLESSKYQALMLIDPQWLPTSILIPLGEPIGQVLARVMEVGIAYPLIAKPDIGERGNGVEKINNEHELRTYLSTATMDTIIQAYVDFPLELGVFYHRYPNEKKGEITSVVIKDFLSIIGDGSSTVQQLIHQHIRAQKRLAYLENKFAQHLNHILPIGEKLLLEPIGNHSRGTTFLNGNHLINEQLVAVFDKISKPIAGFNYGRFDLRVTDEADLYQGKNIKIVELNGVSSEPAHIYDPNYPIWKAYKDLFHHFYIVYTIARQNHAKGYAYTPIKVYWKDFLIHYRR